MSCPFFDDKLRTLKVTINYLVIVYNNMTYKNTDNLITEYAKVCED